MAKEYIEREALKRTLIDKKGFYPAIVKEAIETAPAADVVEVCRCKDCTRGFAKFLKKEKVIECQLFRYDDPRQYKDPMDYCSHGVRKNKDD